MENISILMLYVNEMTTGMKIITIQTSQPGRISD